MPDWTNSAVSRVRLSAKPSNLAFVLVTELMEDAACRRATGRGARDRRARAGKGMHRAEGLGPGVFICGTLIEAHGDDLGVESRLGQGSIGSPLPLAAT
jgi:hypothetical protein